MTDEERGRAWLYSWLRNEVAEKAKRSHRGGTQLACDFEALFETYETTLPADIGALLRERDSYKAVVDAARAYRSCLTGDLCLEEKEFCAALDALEGEK